MPTELKYPVGEHHPEKLQSPSGIRFQDLTLDALLEGRIGMDDLRITPEALTLQAEIARRAGRPQLAASLERAAELVNVPDDKVLKVYESLRPGRSDRETLSSLAQELETLYNAPLTARFLREAAAGTYP